MAKKILNLFANLRTACVYPPIAEVLYRETGLPTEIDVLFVSEFSSDIYSSELTYEEVASICENNLD